MRANGLRVGREWFNWTDQGAGPQPLQTTFWTHTRTGAAMWGFEQKKNVLWERMLLTAPEADPHQFVRRYLLKKTQSRANAVPSKGTQSNGRQTSPSGPRSTIAARAMAANR